MRWKRRVLLLLSAYDPETHQSAVEAARKFNWHLDTNVLTPLRMVDRWRGDGILCSLAGDDREADFVKNGGVPSVDLSTWRTDLSMPRVSADNRAIGRLAAEHFFAFAHRNFAWYGSTRTPFGEARFSGLQEALAENDYAARRIDGRGSQDYAVMARRVRQLPRPCAILAMSDADASWIASLCQEEGYNVPMDFAILGINNNPLVCEVQSVPLSSIDKDAQRVTTEGARLLQAAMDGEPVPHEITHVPPRGVITRASSDAFAIEDDIVRRAMRCLLSHLSERIGAPEVAAELGISRSALNQRFREVTNSSLHRALMRMRLHRAAELLATTDWNLEAIASAAGFTHAPHLGNAFKNHYRQTPLQYRRMKGV